MARSNLNRVMITGNLTADPELRATSSGVSVCELRIANNVSVKKEGQWGARVNYFQANVWGKLAENCVNFLNKGSAVAIDGKLEWQKWETKEGKTNSRVLINVDSIEFIGGKKQGSSAEPAQTSTDDDLPF